MLYIIAFYLPCEKLHFWHHVRARVCLCFFYVYHTLFLISTIIIHNSHKFAYYWVVYIITVVNKDKKCKKKENIIKKSAHFQPKIYLCKFTHNNQYYKNNENKVSNKLFMFFQCGNKTYTKKLPNKLEQRFRSRKEYLNFHMVSFPPFWK